MGTLVVIIGIVAVSYIVLCYTVPAVAKVALVPFVPFVTAYRIRKEKPVQSVLLILTWGLLWLAVLLLFLIRSFS